MRVFSPKGELEATITLQPPADVSQGDYDYATQRWRAVDDVLFDAEGAIYMVYSTRRPRAKWVELKPDFRITRDTVIYKFDSQGRFVLKLSFEGLPFTTGPPAAIDPAGNIYHLRYRSDGVDFVKEAWEADSEAGSG